MRFLLIQPFSLCLYAFSLPAVIHPTEEDKGCTRVQWLARKFELMASAKYPTASEQILLASVESSRRSSSEHNEHFIRSAELMLVNNIDQLYSDDDQEQEDDNELLDYEIQSEISDNYAEDAGRRDSVISETNSINDGSVFFIENIADNATIYFDDKEQRNSHTAENGSISFLR